VAAAGIALGVLTSSGGVPPQRPKPGTRSGDGRAVPLVFGHIYVRGNGIGDAHLGQAETSAIADLDEVLGNPSAPVPTTENGNCGIDAYMQWQSVTAYFGQQKFIGYRAGGYPRTSKATDATTTAGLRVGDTLTQARRIYRSALTTSFAQGGSWFAATSSGRLAGTLSAEVNQTNLVPRVKDITAGTVGCAGVSP
jgi:hypothetical protein